MVRSTIALAAALLVATLLPGTAGATVDSDGWDRRGLPVGDGAQVLVGNFGGDEADDLLIYRPGPGADAIWYGREGVRGTSRWVKRPLDIRGTYQPIVGDFVGGSRPDILWYAPGAARDYLWPSTNTWDALGGDRQKVLVNGRYRWAVLHDHRGGKDDIAWVGLGDEHDYVWHYDDSGNGSHFDKTVSADGAYELTAGDFDGNGYDDLFLYAPGPKHDEIWRSSTVGTVSRTTLLLNNRYRLAPITRPGPDDLLLISATGGHSTLWRGGSKPFSSAVGLGTYADNPTPTPFGTEHALLYGPQAQELRFLDTSTTVGDEALSAEGPDQTDQVPAIGDFDHDGNLDIAWYSPGSSTDSIWYAPSA